MCNFFIFKLLTYHLLSEETHNWAFPPNSGTQPCLWMVEEAPPWDGQPGNGRRSWIRPNTMFFSRHSQALSDGVTDWLCLFWGAPSPQAQGCHRSESMLLLSSPPTAQASSQSTVPSLHSPQPTFIRQPLLRVLVTGNPEELRKKRIWKTCKGWRLREERSGKQPHFYVSGCRLADWPLDFRPQPLGKAHPPLSFYLWIHASFLLMLTFW